MAAKLSPSSSPTPQLLCSFSLHSKRSFKDSTQQQSWLRQAPIPPNPPLSTRAKKQQLAVAVAMQEPLLSSTSALIEHINNHDQNNPLSLYLLAESTVGYSLASYYTSLGLFVISVPGLWSLIKRSVKSKIVQKTFVGEGESNKKAPNQVAGEILSFFTRNNFAVTDRGEVVTETLGVAVKIFLL